jgi:WD40 repeat protein
VANLRTPKTAVYGVALSPDGKTLATATAHRQVKLWDIASRRAVTLFQAPSDGVDSVAFSPDGKILASGGDPVRLWEVATRREVGALRGHTAPVRSVAFSPDGKTLASASWDKTVGLWDVATRRAVATLRGHAGTAGRGAAAAGSLLDGRASLPDTAPLPGGGRRRQRHRPRRSRPAM